MSAPSSPKRFGEYYSAPTSPMRASMVYQEYQDYNRYMNSSSSSVIPLEDDFAFDFDGKLERTSLTAADELFDDGKIKPLTFPMRSQLSNESTHKSSVLSPKSQGKKMFWESFTPRDKKEFNPYSDSTDLTRKSSEQNRGRGRSPTKSNAPLSSDSSSRRRESRSLSPLRVAEFSSYVQQQQEEEQNSKEQPIPWNSKKSDSTSSFSSLKGSRKWRIRDFLLFRSASEGRASDKDPLRKYTALTRKNEDDIKNSSFRSIDSSGSVSRRKGGGGSVSAHEVHYKVNRAVIEESKKKTYLPYKPGLLGCIGFNPTAYGISQRL
ncbi:hypothetical protein MKX01_019211 [Papaver californicum]|nr:hypothetical protein MKX01_019211 [Papaver californicum]